MHDKERTDEMETIDGDTLNPLYEDIVEHCRPSKSSRQRGELCDAT